jgi:hypothetical protein
VDCECSECRATWTERYEFDFAVPTASKSNKGDRQRGTVSTKKTLHEFCSCGKRQVHIKGHNVFWTPCNCSGPSGPPPTPQKYRRSDVLIQFDQPTKSDVVLESIADEIISGLFVNGFGQVADRLALMDDTRKRDLGGWCRGAVRDRIIAVLQTHTKELSELKGKS